MSDDIDAIFRRHETEAARRRGELQQQEESRKKWAAVDALLSQIEHFSSDPLAAQLGREPTPSELYDWYANLLIQYCRTLREADPMAALPDLTPAADRTRLGLAVLGYAWGGNSREIVSILDRAERAGGAEDNWLATGMVTAVIDLLHRMRGTKAPISGGWVEPDSGDAGPAEGTAAGSDPAGGERAEGVNTDNGNGKRPEPVPAAEANLMARNYIA